MPCGLRSELLPSTEWKLCAAPRRANGAVSIAAAAALVLVFLASGCGYHVAGRGNNLPAEWKTVAVSALRNRTTTYRIEQRLTEAVVREMLARTHYRIVADERNADAALRGEVTSIETSALLFDTTTNRATAMLVTVRLAVRLVDLGSQKAVYENNDFIFREEYEISTDIPSFFEEQGPALERMSRDFAGALVSALLESF
jgi:outer membrane lipopolysaccharide assembly protein LptE/RlpB